MEKEDASLCPSLSSSSPSHPRCQPPSGSEHSASVLPKIQVPSTARTPRALLHPVSVHSIPPLSSTPASLPRPSSPSHVLLVPSHSLQQEAQEAVGLYGPCWVHTTQGNPSLGLTGQGRDGCAASRPGLCAIAPGRRAGAPPLWQLARSFPVTGPQPLTPLRRAGCSPPGSSVHGLFQARILECMPFPPPGDLPDPGVKPMSPVSSA